MTRSGQPSSAPSRAPPACALPRSPWSGAWRVSTRWSTRCRTPTPRAKPAAARAAAAARRTAAWSAPWPPSTPWTCIVSPASGAASRRIFPTRRSCTSRASASVATPACASPRRRAKSLAWRWSAAASTSPWPCPSAGLSPKACATQPNAAPRHAPPGRWRCAPPAPATRVTCRVRNDDARCAAEAQHVPGRGVPPWYRRDHPRAPRSCMLEHMQSDRDYYEVMQISRNADIETIHRVYRMMATRFHPDNPRSGSTETFLVLKRAYNVLADPVRRAQYDSTRLIEEEQPLPIFELKDFVFGLTGEVNRRLGVLSLLYNRRRASLDTPGLSVLDLEKRMAFPREHLNFTLWYLKAKGYVRQ